MDIAEYPGRPYKLAPEARSPRQAALLERITSGPRKEVPINLRIWIHNVAFADVAEKFGEYVSQLAPFSPRAKEIVILGVASHWRSEFEWHFHASLGKKHGLTDAQLDAIWRHEAPTFEDPKEQVTYDLVTALNDRREVSDELHRRAMELLGHEGVSDIVGLTGLYTMIAQTILFYRLAPPSAG